MPEQEGFLDFSQQGTVVEDTALDDTSQATEEKLIDFSKQGTVIDFSQQGTVIGDDEDDNQEVPDDPLDNIVSSLQNAWTATKQLPDYLSLLSNKIGDISESASFAGHYIARPDEEEDLSMYDYIRKKKLEHRERYPGLSATEGLIQSASNLIESNKELKPTQGVFTSIKKGDIPMISSSVAGSVIDMSRSVALGALTGGLLPSVEMIGNSYVGALEAKAESTGKSHVDLLIEDQDDELIPLSLGILGGVLEKFGNKGITKKMLSKNIVGKTRDILKDLVDPRSSQNKEAMTEWLQHGIESANRKIASTEEGALSETVDFGQELVNSMFSEEGANAFLAGKAGSGVITSVSTIVKGNHSEADIESVIENADPELVAKEVSKELDKEPEIEKKKTEEKSKRKLKVSEEGALSQFNKKDLKEIRDLAESTGDQSTIDSIDNELEARSKEDSPFNKATREQSKKISKDLKETKSKEDSDLVAAKKKASEEAVKSGGKLKKDESKESRNKSIAKLESLVSETKKGSNFFNKGKRRSTVGKIRAEITKAIDKIRPFATNIKDISKFSKPINNWFIDNLYSPHIKAKAEATVIKNKGYQLVKDHVKKGKLNAVNLNRVGIVGTINNIIGKEKKDGGVNTLQDGISFIEKSIENAKRLGNSSERKKAKNQEEALNSLKEFIEKNKSDNLEGSLSEEEQSMLDDIHQSTQETSGISVDDGQEADPSYFRRKALGGWQEISSKKKAEAFEREFEGEVDNTLGKKSVEKARKEIKKDVFYDFNAEALHVDYVRNTAAVLVRKNTSDLRKLLFSSKFKEIVGEQNVERLKSQHKAFMLYELGHTAPKSMAAKATQGFISKWIQLTLSNLAALPKQASGILVQIPSIAPANKVAETYNYALDFNAKIKTKDGKKVSVNDWLAEHVPTLMARYDNLEHMVLGDLEKSKLSKGATVGEKIVDLTESKQLRYGDFIAAKGAFFASYFKEGGDMQNPDPKKIIRAIANQEIYQGANAPSTGGSFFVDNNETAMTVKKLLFAYTNFALSAAGANSSAMKNLKNNPVAASGALATIFGTTAAFALISEATKGIKDELSDEAFGEDDEDDSDNWLSTDDEPSVTKALTKAAARGAFDMQLLGSLPIISDVSADFMNETDIKAIKGLRDIITENESRKKVFFGGRSKYGTDYQDTFGAVGGAALNEVSTIIDAASSIMDEIETNNGVTSTLQEKQIDILYNRLMKLGLIVTSGTGLSRKAIPFKGEAVKYLDRSFWEQKKEASSLNKVKRKYKKKPSKKKN